MKKIRLNIFGLLTLVCALTPIALGGCSNGVKVGELTVAGEAPEDASSDDGIQDDSGDGDGEPSQGDVDSPDVVESMCGDGTKLCDGVCVPTDSIEHCLGCQPCPLFDEGANVETTCTNTGCQYECAPSFVDLNDDFQDDTVEGDGCECDSKDEEVCDGEDNDCDGEIDEGVDNGCGGCVAFEDGGRPGDECGQPECLGTRVCDPDDNNSTVCEGSEDLNACEGCGALLNSESLGEPGAECGDCGVVLCDGVDAVRCEHPDFTEYFEDRDEDSFGADEGGSEMLCAPGGTDGVFTATERGDCDDQGPDINPDAEELCDGVDNDCDMQVDEGSPEVLLSNCPELAEAQSSACDAGVCEYVCDEGHEDLDRDLTNPAESNGCECAIEAEFCDGEDNDCDGEIDEEVAPLVATLTEGVCVGQVQICDGGVFIEPDYSQIEGYEADIELTCDGLDNNCDGFVDNGELEVMCPELDGAQISTCAAGVCVYVCISGRADFDEDLINGSEGNGCECIIEAEVCDGEDNDCDGEIDEGSPEVLLSDCFELEGAQPQACNAGRCEYACAEGRVDLNANINEGLNGDGCECAIEAEVCDGEDNDCDGLVDETLCQGFEGVCAGASVGCGAEPLVCSEQVLADHADANNDGRYESGFEVSCGGDFDNDCDGTSDEDCCQGFNDVNARVTLPQSGDFLRPDVIIHNDVGDATILWQEEDVNDDSPLKLVRIDRQGGVIQGPVNLSPVDGDALGRLARTSSGFAATFAVNTETMSVVFLSDAWSNLPRLRTLNDISNVANYDVVGALDQDDPALWILSQEPSSGIHLSLVIDNINSVTRGLKAQDEAPGKTHILPKIVQDEDSQLWFGWVEVLSVGLNEVQRRLQISRQANDINAELNKCPAIILQGGSGERHYDLAAGAGLTPLLVFTQPTDDDRIDVFSKTLGGECDATPTARFNVPSPVEHMELMAVPDFGFLLLVRSNNGNSPDSVHIMRFDPEGVPFPDEQPVIVQIGTDVAGPSRMALSPERAFGARWAGLVFSDRSDDDTPFEGFYRQFNLGLDSLCFE